MSFLAPKHRTSRLSLDWVTCQPEQKSGEARQEQAGPGSPPSQELSPVPELSSNSGRRCLRTGEAGLAVWNTESPSGCESRSSHCTLVWRRRRSARLEGETDREAEVQRDRETHSETERPQSRGKGWRRCDGDPRGDKPREKDPDKRDRNAAHRER